MSHNALSQDIWHDENDESMENCARRSKIKKTGEKQDEIISRVDADEKERNLRRGRHRHFLKKTNMTIGEEMFLSWKPKRLISKIEPTRHSVRDGHKQFANAQDFDISLL